MSAIVVVINEPSQSRQKTRRATIFDCRALIEAPYDAIQSEVHDVTPED